MKWFDEKSGEARIDKRGHIYPLLRGSHVDPYARVPGVRVHFDIERIDGIDWATSVKAVVGTRTSHRHRRFGDQSGAHDYESKTASHPDRFADVALARERRPRRLLVEFVRRLANGEMAAARPLLAPNVVLRTGDTTTAGAAAVFDALAESAVSGNGELPVSIAFEDGNADGRILVDWVRVAEQNGDSHMLRASFRVAHGEITEIEWGIDPTAIAPSEPDGLPDIQVVSSGPVSKASVAYGREKLSVVMHIAPQPVLFARLKLTQHTDPAATRPSSTQATIDLDGQILRGFASGDTMAEATDLLERHLVERLRHMRHTGADERAVRSHSPGSSHARSEGRTYRMVSPEDRQIIRHKTIAEEQMTPDEAIWDLHQLDFDFYLFADLESGKDALVTLDDGTVHLVDSVPTLAAGEAKEWLDTTDQPYLFHAGPDARGRVMYRRYDGHYGLLTL
jgi:Sigma 54 modulation/S30EA ribosomal protein C terminus